MEIFTEQVQKLPACFFPQAQPQDVSCNHFFPLLEKGKEGFKTEKDKVIATTLSSAGKKEKEKKKQPAKLGICMVEKDTETITNSSPLSSLLKGT